VYSESDIDAAITSGALTKEAADALRSHASGLRATPSADEEQFRLITSFNDIFVSIAGVMVLVSGAWIGGTVAPYLSGLFLAALSWGLAEFFTRKRRMALPSIIFFIGFVLGVYTTIMSFLGSTVGFANISGADGANPGVMLNVAVSSAVVVGACWAHWRRFMVPITIAWGTLAIAVAVVASLFAMIPGLREGTLVLWVMLLTGLSVFTFAMWWDTQDRNRTTKKTDIAFWLHLVASPMIVHPIFALIGMRVARGMGDDGTSTGTGLAIMAIVLYLVLGLVALIIDRRAFLVSAMIYVLVALVYLFGRADMGASLFPVAALVIGSALLMLSALWQTLRRALLQFLPERIRDRLPATDRPTVTPQRAS
jgi:hypothetical protein